MTPPCAVMSPCLAAGLPPMSTEADPMTMTSGGPVHTSISPTTAAGRPPTRTLGTPGPTTGPPTWGTGPVDRGQVCMSVILAAEGMIVIVFSGHWSIYFYDRSTDLHDPLSGHPGQCSFNTQVGIRLYTDGSSADGQGGARGNRKVCPRLDLDAERAVDRYTAGIHGHLVTILVLYFYFGPLLVQLNAVARGGIDGNGLCLVVEMHAHAAACSKSFFIVGIGGCNGS